MNKSSSKLFLAALALVALAAFTVTPTAEAARQGGGGGGGGGGNRASAGGGGGGGGANRAAPAAQNKNVQANNVNADKRTNNVRNTSANNVNVNNNNNVNVNKNVNVNVDNNGGCCNNGWDNDYHPLATAAAVTATVAVTSAVIGSMVNTVPPSCVPVNYGGMVYQQCGTTWYQSQGPQYVVVNPPY
jgi:hypothetical protein